MSNPVDPTDESGGPPTVKDGRVLYGVCDICQNPIYSGQDHDEGCIYR